MVRFWVPILITNRLPIIVRDRDAEWRFWGLGIFASTVSIGTAACYYARCESDGNDKIDLTKLFTQVFVKKAYLQEVQKNENDRDPPDRSDLPTFSFDEVKRHGKNSDRIWVSHFQQPIKWWLTFKKHIQKTLNKW